MIGEWFYWSDGIPRLGGREELARESTWILRQRRLRVFGRSVFFGEQEVALEVIWRFIHGPPPGFGR